MPVGAARGRGLANASIAGLSAGHGPLRAARGRDSATTVGLRWTCGPNNSASGQWQEHVVKSRLGNLHLRLSPTE